MELAGIYSELWKGKSLGRALQNMTVAKYAQGIRGKVLDLGGGTGSYYRFLPKDISIVRTNIAGDTLDEIVDITKPLPYNDGAFNAVLLFNVLYIADQPQEVIREIRRVLSKEGMLIMATPFIANEMREPHDYWRFTREGLELMLMNADFTSYTCHPIGERFSSALTLMNPSGNKFLWLTLSPLALLADRMLPKKTIRRSPAPLGYLTIATCL